MLASTPVGLVIRRVTNLIQLEVIEFDVIMWSPAAVDVCCFSG